MKVTWILFLLTVLTVISAKFIKTRPKLSYNEPWKYIGKFIMQRAGNWYVQIENIIKELPENFRPEISPIPRFEVLVYNEHNYYKALDEQTCIAKRNRAMAFRDEKIFRILPKETGKQPDAVVSPSLRLGPYKTTTTLYFVACACSSPDHQKKAKQQHNFTLDKRTYRQLVGNINLKLTVKNNPNRQMSLELMNIDNKYLYFSFAELIVLCWAIYRFRQYYRMTRSCETPLIFLLVSVALDLVGSWMMWVHFDWYTGNGKGIVFLYVLSNMAEVLSHFVILTIFGAIALGWMLPSALFPDNEPQLVTAIGLILVGIVVGGLNVLSIDSDSNFYAYGTIQSICLSLFCLPFVAQQIYEFSQLQQKIPSKFQITLNQMSVVGIINACLFPVLTFFVRVVGTEVTAYSLQVVLYQIFHLGIQCFLLAKLGSKHFWREVQYDDLAPLPNRRNKAFDD